MLEYDNSAFYYFALTLLSIYLVPGTYAFLKELYLAFFGSTVKARTQAEKKKVADVNGSTTGLGRLSNRSFILKSLLLLAVWALFLYLVSLVSADGEVSQFDPYQILGVENGAAEKAIKSAYRKLSLKYHPDKNIGNKAAEEMFMKIAKAYEALTNEASKENYEKYGNPDGKQSLEVSIGLPTWILDNPKVVLVLYLIFMVLLIPICVGLWYSNSKKYGDKNIMYDSYRAFYHLLKETSKLRNMPEILACSTEFRDLNVFKPEQKAKISEIVGKMQADKLMEKPIYDKNVQIMRGNILVHTHMLRMHGMLTPDLKGDLDSMLKIAPELIEGMTEIAQQQRWLEATLQTIKFAQCVKQALFRGADPLQQLPHLDAEARKEVAGMSETKDKALITFLRAADDKKAGLNRLTADQRQDVLDTAALLPARDVTITLFVEEEDDDDDEEEEEEAKDDEVDSVVKAKPPSGKDIYEGDLVTMRVSLARKGVAKQIKAAPALTPYFPATVHEGIWMILTGKPDGGKEGVPMIHGMEKIADGHKLAGTRKDTSNCHTVEHDIRFMAPPAAGSYSMQLYIFSDTYMGLDELIDVDFDVKPAAELPAYEPHPEDMELENEPTLFEQVMAANQDEADSSDDDDEGEVPTWAAKKGGDGAASGSGSGSGSGSTGAKNTTTSSAADDSDDDDEDSEED
jgi:translocation protein SEC63